jgi:hypothetical protein
MIRRHARRFVSPVPSGPCRRMTDEEAFQASFGPGAHPAGPNRPGRDDTVGGWPAGFSITEGRSNMDAGQRD